MQNDNWFWKLRIIGTGGSKKSDDKFTHFDTVYTSQTHSECVGFNVPLDT